MGLPARVRCPFLQLTACHDKENKMLFDRERFLVMREVSTMEEAAARTGFSVSDIKALVDCELDTVYVLDYISTVVANRMN